MMQQTLILHRIILLSCKLDVLKHEVLLQSLAKGKKHTNRSQQHQPAGENGDLSHLFVEVYGRRIESTLRIRDCGCPYSVLMVSRLRNRLIAAHML